MARFVLLLPFVGAAAADAACPDGACPADADDHLALLQHRAARAASQSANVTSWPPPADVPHCTSSPAGTCGNPSVMCVRDAQECSSSGGSINGKSGCMAAGASPPAAPNMGPCRYCGNGGDECPPAKACTAGNDLASYACQAGMSEDELCQHYPDTTGCPSAPTPGPPAPPACCLAETVECKACQKGVSEDEYCQMYPNDPVCPPRPCCKGLVADCLACEAGVPVDYYCQVYPCTVGCSGEGCQTGVQCSNAGNKTTGARCEYNYWNGSSVWFGCCDMSLWCTSIDSNGNEKRCIDSFGNGYPSEEKQPKMLNASECTGSVQCPGSSDMCSGDQCCPGIPETGGLTFPCPSASSKFGGCANNGTKVATCPIPEP